MLNNNINQSKMFKNKEELKNYLSDNWDKCKFIKLSLNKNIKNIIEIETEFLNNYYSNIPLRTRAYVIVNQITSDTIPKCKCGCNRVCSIDNTYSDRGFRSYANSECSRKVSKIGEESRLKLENYDGNIVSYADRRYSDGNVYIRNGFSLIKINSPSYYYVDKNYNQRYNRMKFQKKLIGAYDCTEFEKAREMGYNKIFDCGTICFGLE